MFQHILVPLDGSALAEQTPPTAARLARVAHGSVILLRTVRPPVEYASGGTYMIYTPLNTMERLMKEEEAEARCYLEEIAASPALEGVHTQLEGAILSLYQLMAGKVSSMLSLGASPSVSSTARGCLY